MVSRTSSKNAPLWTRAMDQGADSHAPAADEPSFHQMRQGCVSQQESRDNGPVKRRQWGELQRLPNERKGQCDTGDTYDERSRDEGGAGATLQKRDLRGADDVDDERLRQQGFDKPAGLEQRRVIPTVEDIEHGEESRIVEDRADRSDEDHEFENIADVPFARNREILLVDIVRGDGGLREIIEQIVGEDLNGQHRQEGQEDAGAEHAEHIAEIRTRAHLDIFGDIAENLAPFDYAFLKHHQTLFEQDDVRRFLGDVDGRIDGNADVGGLERRAVVDAIAQESNDMAPGMKGADHTGFLRRGELGEDSCLFGKLGQRALARSFNVWA